MNKPSPSRVDHPIQRLLLVEDNAGDARLLREMISEGGAQGIEWTHVESLAAAEKHLADGVIDLILLDLGLPDSQGLETLRRAKLAAPRVPVVVLSGLDNESLALEALHQGAEDYLVKGQISARELRRSMRHAVEREGLKDEVQAEKGSSRMAGELFQALVENVPDIIARFSGDLRHLYVSPSVLLVTGRPPEDFVGRTNRELGMPLELVERWDAALLRVLQTGEAERLEFAYAAQDGTRQFDCRFVPELGSGNRPISVLTVARDVTDRWLAHEAERSARAVAEELRQATIELTRSLDREVVLVTLLDRLRQLVPFDRASVMLLEERSRLAVRAVYDGDRVVPVSVASGPKFATTDHPVVQTILTTGAAVLIPDLSAHPDWGLSPEHPRAGSWMGVPLFARGSVAGLVALTKAETDAFSADQVRVAEAMSSQASVAVENAVLFEQMQASTLRMQSLSRRLVETQESERRSISRELHDEAGQSLASLRFGLRLLEREIEQGRDVTGKVSELVQTTDAVIDGLHRLAADLRPASLDHLGLDAALRQYSHLAASKFGLAVSFKARGFTTERLPSVVETALYRVVQEAMTNVARHAQAKRVDILLERSGERVRVMVEDDGVGFDPAEVQRGDHFGLLGMRERAEALGGNMNLESAVGSGTTVVVEVASAYPHPDR